jgi:hypothetical protein
MYCKNKKCSNRDKQGECEVWRKRDSDMKSEYFVDENICGLIEKLTYEKESEETQCKD